MSIHTLLIILLTSEIIEDDNIEHANALKLSKDSKMHKVKCFQLKLVKVNFNAIL